MNKQVFIINGTGGCGKDTFVSLFSEELKKYNKDTINYSSVQIIKEIACRVGWQGGKTEKDRKFLSDLKALCAEYSDAPFQSMCEVYDLFLKANNTDVLFLHIREPEEIERAKQKFNAKTILVKRNSVKEIKSNSSDARVNNYNYDITIENNGDMNDLKETVWLFVKKYFKKTLSTNTCC